MFGVSNDVEQQILEAKEFLLKTNPAKLSDNDNLTAILNEFTNCFDILFGKVSNQTEGLADASRLIVIDSFSIWLQRVTQLLQSKKINSNDYFMKVKMEMLPIESNLIIIEYVIDFWADGGPALGNALKDIFTKYIRLAKILHSTDDIESIMKAWRDKTIELPSTLKVQYYLLDTLSNEVDLFTVLEKKPDFIQTSLSLMWSDSLSNPIGKSVSNLLINVFKIHFQNDNTMLKVWLGIWYTPVLHYLDNPKFTKAIELYILTPLFKGMPNQMFSLFIKTIKLENPFQLLPLLKIGQELAIEEEPFHEDRFLSITTIKSLLKQDKYKLRAFELLTFSTKKSKPIHPYILDIIKSNIQIFFTDNEIETRNYFCSSFHHFVIRLRDSAYSLNRDVNKLKKANKFPQEQQEKSLKIKEIKSFINWLIRFLESQLGPGSQYQRNDASFRIFRSLIESGLDDTIDEKYFDNRERREYPFTIHIFENETLLRLLLDNLTNNFNDIRRSSKELLLIALSSSISSQLLTLIHIEQLEQNASQMVSRYQTCDMGAVLHEFLFYISENKSTYISNLLTTLEHSIPTSDSEYIKNVNHPISGYCTSLALILNQYQLKTNNQFEVEICNRSIKIVLKIWNIVKEIVCHDSSEGILPTKFSESGLTDRVIISYAFKSIKESSGILESLLLKYPLTKEQLVTIGKLFIAQLFNIRHSGAFQAVFPGFTAFCKRCRNDEPELLDTWLKEIISSIEVKTQHITRRSGGMPFLITTILSTEKVTSRPQLEYAFDNLKRIASAPIAEHQDKLDLPQINAFNCIRAIFIESKLSEPCTSYVAAALKLSLSNFTSELWSLRNCSIMLFTSLQNRIFGKVGKSISARLFFTRYSGVREDLLSILKSSFHTVSSEHQDQNPKSNLESIFLVLNLLLRLKPTPGYTGLDDFKDEVIRCLGNENWKIREMAARTIASLVEDHSQQCQSLFKDVSLSYQARTHGNLLAIINIISKNILGTSQLDIHQKLVDDIFNSSKELLTENPCYSTSKAYIQLAKLLFEKGPQLDPGLRKNFLSNLGHYFVNENSTYAVEGTKQLCLSVAIDILLCYESTPNVVDICELGLMSPFFEVQLICIEHVIKNFNLKDMKFASIVDVLDELYLDNNMLPTMKSKILNALRNSPKPLQLASLIEIIDQPNGEELQLSAIESIGDLISTDSSNNVWIKIKGFCDDTLTENYRFAALKCLINYFKISNDPRAALQIYKMLNDDDEDIREYSALFLNEYFFNLTSWKIQTSPFSTARLFKKEYIERYNSESDCNAVLEELEVFLNSFTFSDQNSTEIDNLFDIEKDNIYRNDIEENLEYIFLLKEYSQKADTISSRVVSLKNKFINDITDNKLMDSPMGWASNPDAFSRLVILNILVKEFAPTELHELNTVFKKFQVHPLVTSFVMINE